MIPNKIKNKLLKYKSKQMQDVIFVDSDGNKVDGEWSGEEIDGNKKYYILKKGTKFEAINSGEIEPIVQSFKNGSKILETKVRA